MGLLRTLRSAHLVAVAVAVVVGAGEDAVALVLAKLAGANALALAAATWTGGAGMAVLSACREARFASSACARDFSYRPGSVCGTGTQANWHWRTGAWHWPLATGNWHWRWHWPLASGHCQTGNWHTNTSTRRARRPPATRTNLAAVKGDARLALLHGHKVVATVAVAVLHAAALVLELLELFDGELHRERHAAGHVGQRAGLDFGAGRLRRKGDQRQQRHGREGGVLHGCRNDTHTRGKKLGRRMRRGVRCGATRAGATCSLAECEKRGAQPAGQCAAGGRALQRARQWEQRRCRGGQRAAAAAGCSPRSRRRSWKRGRRKEKGRAERRRGQAGG